MEEVKPAKDVVAVSKLDQWKWLVTPATLLLLAVAVQRGWLTQGEADKIKPLVVVAQADVETKPVGPVKPVEPVVVVRVKSGAVLLVVLVVVREVSIMSATAITAAAAAAAQTIRRARRRVAWRAWSRRTALRCSRRWTSARRPVRLLIVIPASILPCLRAVSR